MRILFVEDEPENIETVQERLREEMRGIQMRTCGFKEAQAEIKTFAPSLVVLDLIGEEEEPEGLGTQEYIWAYHFCPIVIYSAKAEMARKEHPFIREVKKGTGSEEKVLAAVKGFKPHIDALEETRRRVNRELTESMKATAPWAFQNLEDEEEKKDYIARAGRRRLPEMAAEEEDDKPQPGWEQYIHPPRPGELLTGDIIRETGSDENAATSYRVILTPSCDLSKHGGAKAKTDRVLTARCVPTKQALKREGTKFNAGEIRSRLNQGYWRTTLPLPSMKGAFPPMAVDFRQMETLPIEDLEDGKAFERIASQYSPFRELVSEAAAAYVGRAGLPDRDTGAWAKEILDEPTK